MMFTRRTFVATATALLASSAVPRALAKGTGNIFVSTEKGNEVVVLDQSLAVIKRIATAAAARHALQCGQGTALRGLRRR